MFLTPKDSHPLIQQIGFTPDRFDGRLMIVDKIVCILGIRTLNPGQGHFKEFLDTIESEGFQILGYEPNTRTRTIQSKRGMKLFFGNKGRTYQAKPEVEKIVLKMIDEGVQFAPPESQSNSILDQSRSTRESDVRMTKQPLFEIKSGSTRHTILISRWAIKIPRFNFDAIYKSTFCIWEEWRFYSRYRSNPKLCPVLFTVFGLLIVMPRCEEIDTAQAAQEITNLRQDFPELPDIHEKNIGLLNGQIVCLDYGHPTRINSSSLFKFIRFCCCLFSYTISLCGIKLDGFLFHRYIINQSTKNFKSFIHQNLTLKYGESRAIILFFKWAIKIPRFKSLKLGRIKNQSELMFASEYSNGSIAPIVFGAKSGLFIIQLKAKTPGNLEEFRLRLSFDSSLLARIRRPIKASHVGYISGETVLLNYS